MNIDLEAMQQEWMNQIAQAMARVAFLAGENGALKKELASANESNEKLVKQLEACGKELTELKEKSCPGS